MAQVTHTLYNEDNSYRYSYTYTVGFTNQYDINTYESSPVDYFPYTEEGFPSIPKVGYQQYWLVGGTTNEYSPGNWLKVKQCFYEHMNYGYAQNISLYNRYRKIVYTLTLNNNGGTGGTGTIYYWLSNWYSNSEATNQITSIDIPTKTGYSFEGYYVGEGSEQQQIINSDGKIKSGYTISSTTTAKAKWTPKTYVVTFDLNNPTPGDNLKPEPESIDSITVTYYSSYDNLPEPERYGYEFDGWYTLPNGGTKIESTTKYQIDGDSTLYAHWKKKKYLVKIVSGEGIKSVYFNSDIDSAYYELEERFDYYSTVVINAIVNDVPPYEGSEYQFDFWSDGTEIYRDNESLEIIVDKESITYTSKATIGLKTYNVKSVTEKINITLPNGEVVEEDTTFNLIPTSGFVRYKMSNEPLSYDSVYGSSVVFRAYPRDKNYKHFEAEFDGWYENGVKIPETEYHIIGDLGMGDLVEYYPDYGYQMHIMVSRIPHYELPWLVKGDTTLVLKSKVYYRSLCNLSFDENGSAEFLVDNNSSAFIYNDDDYITNSKSGIHIRAKQGTSIKMKAYPKDGYMLDGWYIDDELISTESEYLYQLPIENGYKEINIVAKFKPWEYIWHKDDEDIACHWNDYYIFVKTDKENTPWRVVKEIHHYINDEWKEE